MYLPPVLWAWIRAPATHFLDARILTTSTTSTRLAAFSALPQHLPSPFSVIVLSSQYLFQRGPIWISGCQMYFSLFSNFPVIGHQVVKVARVAMRFAPILPFLGGGGGGVTSFCLYSLVRLTYVISTWHAVSGTLSPNNFTCPTKILRPKSKISPLSGLVHARWIVS